MLACRARRASAPELRSAIGLPGLADLMLEWNLGRFIGATGAGRRTASLVHACVQSHRGAQLADASAEMFHLGDPRFDWSRATGPWAEGWRPPCSGLRLPPRLKSPSVVPSAGSEAQVTTALVLSQCVHRRLVVEGRR